MNVVYNILAIILVSIIGTLGIVGLFYYCKYSENMKIKSDYELKYWKEKYNRQKRLTRGKDNESK